MDIAALPSPSPPNPRHQALMAKAEDLEAVFLAEMLAHAGMGEQQGTFSGEEGEAQFTSFLRQEQARAIVQSGGIGLAESIFASMVRAEGGDDANGT